MNVRKVAASLIRRRIQFHFQRCKFSTTTTTSTTKSVTNSKPTSLSNKLKWEYDCSHGFHGFSWQTIYGSSHIWTIVAAQAAIILGINGNTILADASAENTYENDSSGNIVGLQKVEDGSVVSNIHTTKWRVFTDKGREFFLNGKLDEAEKLFLSALQEAKEGFGDRDPHVASACNNLAELYRIRKALDKAEPLFLEAIEILEESFGSGDVRVGAALHNLGQLYLVQRKLEDSRQSYERALKIKERVLGHAHTDYADTMYHLGMVLSLLGEKDADVLIQDSIRIMEEADQGESHLVKRRLRHLAQIYVKSNNLAEAEKVQRKILHVLELSQGWDSIDTVIAAEELALTLRSTGNLDEALELLERCLNARSKLLPKDHIQIGANMLHLARVELLKSNELRKTDVSKAIAHLDKASTLLDNSIRIATQVLNKLRKPKRGKQKGRAPEEPTREGRAALSILLQSLDYVGLLEITKQQFNEPEAEKSHNAEALNSFLRCVSTYKELEDRKSVSDFPDVKTNYLSCLRHLVSLMIDAKEKEVTVPTLQELTDEINKIEVELSQCKKR